MRKDHGHLYEFGHFRLDTAERRLLRHGQPVPLTPKAFETLVALVEQAGHLVEKEDLMQTLWPDSVVEEANLTNNVWTLRNALDETRHGHRYIETVPKRGYRFVAEVRVIGLEEETELIAERHTVTRIVTEDQEGPESDSHVSAQIEGLEPAALGRQLRATSLTDRFDARLSGLNRKSRLGGLIALGFLLIAAAFGLREFLGNSRAPADPRGAFQMMQVSRFTASGNIVTAAISPDAKYVATVLAEDGLHSLWLRQVAANTSSVRLVAPAQVDYWGLTFSNDSNFIYYVSWLRNESDAVLYQLPVLGGTPRKLPMAIDTPISFSPTGDRFAYVFSSSSKGESYVKVASINGGAVETLVSRRKPEFFAAYPGGPAWSPDGRTIAYAAGGAREEDGQRVHVFVANVEDKHERQLTLLRWMDIGRVTWLGDGSALVMSAREEMDAPRQIWLVSYPEGTASKITNDLHDYDSVSLTVDSKTLTAVQTERTFSISAAPIGDLGARSPELSSASEIFSEVGSGRERAGWTPDNRVVYCSRASGNWDIWLMTKDGRDQRQLTVDPHNDLFPVVSSDGRFIFFASDRAGSFNIWRMGIDGGNPLQLTRGFNQILPEATPDGQWLVYQQGLGPDEPSIWRVPAGGGEPERLTDSLTLRPEPSPDGRLLAYVYLDEKEWGLAVASFEGGEVRKKFPFPPTVGSRFFRWSPDGRALAYIANERGTSNIWLQPLNGDRPRQLTNFQEGQLFSFTWSPDGRWQAYMRHTATSDVVLLKGFR